MDLLQRAAIELNVPGAREDAETARRRAQRRAAEHAREVARARAALRRGADEVVSLRSARWANLPLRVTPASAPAAGTQDGFGGVSVWSEDARGWAGIVTRLYARLADGHAAGPGAAMDIAGELAERALRGPARVAAWALGVAAGGRTLGERAVALAGLGAASAVGMGWGRIDARDAALTGLLCDAGMTLLTHDVRHAARGLTEVEANALRRHPGLGVAMLELCRGGGEGLPERVGLAVHSHHEREDGTGYGRGLRSLRIHDLSRLIAPADVLVGLVSPRADRPGVPAAQAVREVARQANAGALWADAARALVLAVGAYPPGSRVRLSTGHEAEVVRASVGGRVDRPVVRVILGSGRGEEMDLAWWGRGEVRVVGAA